MNMYAAADRISRAEVAELLGAMVAIPSINPYFHRQDRPSQWFGEGRLAAFIADWLRSHAVEVELVEVLPGRANVVARLRAPSGAATMVWEGHTDTVQVDLMEAPFEPRIEGGKLYGRGAVDDKASLAMFMLAMRKLKRTGCACDLTFVAAVDEEVTFRGVVHHVQTNVPYDLGIAGEPTCLEVVSACKGVIRWVVDIEGRAAHSSTPDEGVDALLVAADLVRHLSDYMKSSERSHPLLGRRTLTCTRMEAGEGPNTVPASASLVFDMRTLPDQTGNEAWQEIHGVVEAFASSHPAGANIVTNPCFVDSISMEVPHDERIVTALSQVLRDHGRSGRVIGVPFGSDASKMTRGGTPTVVFGPGSIAQAHARDEHVDLDEVALGADVLVALAKRL